MKNISILTDARHFILDFVDLIPQQISKIWIHVLLTVGIIGGWKLFKKHAKKMNSVLPHDICHPISK